MRRITSTQVEKLAKTKGRHWVDDNLILLVRENARPSWVFRFVAPDGRRRDMTMGRYPAISLAKAREQARDARTLLEQGVDPIEARDQDSRKCKHKDFRETYTLRQAACELHDQMRPAWKNDKHAAQWLNSLEHLGNLLDEPLESITASRLLERLEPLNQDMHETTKRIRQRVEAIFDRAIIHERVENNPAAALKRQLRTPAKRKHHPAISWKEVPAFISNLRDSDMAQSSRLAFEWLILTATRTSETIYATWDEINEEETVWTIPSERMKMGEYHEVPITDRMRQILAAMSAQRGDGWNWLFPSPQKRVKPISNNAFLAYIHRIGRRGEVTPHGMRSAFSDWAHETQPIRSDIIEAALAHVEENAAKAAYNRTTYWQHRIDLAAAWDKFVTE